mmetsp:Transcript_36680/g.86101  ORF Transcript_36680/g.86101 Transcript_36680/m.86101 type:complete len:313 (-) Transcript_36680:99-1037(-)|eukprot:s5916_g2.t1
MDFKQELNQFLQKHCKRPLTKTDITYTVSKYGTQFQAIVRLNCVNGQEYAGHLMADAKAAEKSAAQQAIEANATLVEAAKTAPADKKRQAQKPPISAEEREAKKAKQEAGENPAVTPKTELNSLCMKIIGRFLKKGETVYVCNKIGMQYQATVQITSLPDEWGQRAWAGHLCANKQKAEQSAAEIALGDIKGDEKLQELASQFKGKGKGKGKWDMQAMWEMMNNWWTWNNTRERVIEEDVLGELIEWKGHYGWVKTDHDFEHEAKGMRDGKIYMHRKDIEGQPEALAEGQKVKFKLYADGSGLGAEEVTLCV